MRAGGLCCGVEVSYRAAPLVCPDCVARANESERVAPFCVFDICPACRCRDSKREYDFLPGAHHLIVKRGWWLLRWWGRQTIDCNVGPLHFHMRCRSCGYRWLMAPAFAEASK